MKPAILVVDDVPTNIMMISEALADDYEVRFATGGDEALALMDPDNPVDLILLDIVMPGIDGYEVCRRLKARPETSEIPVMFLTGKGEEEAEAQGLEVGAIGYIRKPFKPQLVRARVKSILHLQEMLEKRVRGQIKPTSPRPEGSSSRIEAGTKLGSYTLLGQLGLGAMGEVWRATHDLLGREAAVKLVRFNGAGGSEGAEVERFQREAQALASLRSPHTLRLYEYGISPKFYLVTELLKGLDLESIVESFGPLPLARCIRLMRHACLSLAEAHAAGFFHRDVKPGNLFCCRRIGGEHDVLKVLDFGLVNAPLAAIGDGESHLTSPGVFLGTPQTSSPEAAKCRPDEIDAQSDLYSLGCTIYYLVTGGDVFRGPPLRVLMDHISKDPDPPSKRLGRQLPPEFDALIMSCLSKTKADRPADADEVIRRLDEIPIEDPWGPDEAQRWWSGRGVRPRSPEQARDADPTSALTP